MTLANAADFDVAPIRERIRSEMTERAVPSLSVAVSRDDTILWEEGFGWADRERRIPATPHTLYSLASITKPMTATALMILVERGRIDLDAPVNDLLGDSPITVHAGDERAATVRRVASHTAGLPLHFQFFYADEPHRRPPMEESIRRYGHIVTPPGECFHYSNFGYGILDHLIARVSGTSYADFMRREVFLPLGMTRASIDVGPGLEPYAAARYGRDGLPYPHYDFDHPGGSAAYCSAHDLLRFGRFHIGVREPDAREILTTESRLAMQTPVPTEAGEDEYGIGWRSAVEPSGIRTVSHSGGMGGVSTTLLLVPDEQIAVAALCSAEDRLPHVIAEDLLAAMIPAHAEYLAKRREEERKERERKEAEAGDAERREEPPVPASLAGEWAGEVWTHRGPLPLALSIRANNEAVAQIGDQLKAFVNDVKWKDGEGKGDAPKGVAPGVLKGVFAGDIGTEDANRRPYRLHFELSLRENRLQGVTIALTHVESEGGAPGRRVGNALSHWTDLERK